MGALINAATQKLANQDTAAQASRAQGFAENMAKLEAGGVLAAGPGSRTGSRSGAVDSLWWRSATRLSLGVERARIAAKNGERSA